MQGPSILFRVLAAFFEAELAVMRPGHNSDLISGLAMKKLDVLSIIHYGRDGAVVDDKCRCCN